MVSAVLVPELSFSATDSVWNETNFKDTLSSEWFLDSSHWTQGNRTDGGYYLGNDSEVTVSDSLKIDAPLFVGYDSSDPSHLLNLNPGKSSLTVEGNLEASKLVIGNQWGITNGSGEGRVTVKGSLTLSGNLWVGQNGFGALTVGSGSAGDSVTIGSASSLANVQFSYQAAQSSVATANPTQIDFSQVENVTIHADNFLISAVKTGFADNFKPDTSGQKFMTGANVKLGTNNSISANYLILASSYGQASTTHSTLELGEGTNDLSIAKEMIIGGLKADKAEGDAPEGVNVVTIREGGVLNLHGAEGADSKTNLSIAKSTCGTTNISYGTLDLRNASSVTMNLANLTIGFKTEEDSSSLVRYGGAEGFLYLGNSAVVTADRILMAFKSEDLIDETKGTHGTLNFGGKTSVTTARLELGNDTHAYSISTSTIVMNGGTFLVTNGAEFFDDVNLTIGSSSDSAGKLQTDGRFSIYSPRAWEQAQTGRTDETLSDTALRASSNTRINISGNAFQKIYGNVLCVRDANQESEPDGCLHLTLSDAAQYCVYGNFAAGNDSTMTLSGNSRFYVQGISKFEARNILILDETGYSQKGPTYGTVTKTVSGNALYEVDGGIELKGNSSFTVSDSAKVLVQGNLNVDSTYEYAVYRYDSTQKRFNLQSSTSNGKCEFQVHGGTVDLQTLRLAGTWNHQMTDGKFYANSIVTAFNEASDTHEFGLSGGQLYAQSITQEAVTFDPTGLARSEITFTGGDLSVLQIGTPNSPFNLTQSRPGTTASILHVGNSVTTDHGTVTSLSRYGTTSIYGDYAIRNGAIELELNGSERDRLNVYGSVSVEDAILELKVGTEGIAFDGHFTENGADYAYVTLLAAEIFSDLTAETLPEAGNRVASTLNFSYLWPEEFTEGWSYYVYSTGNGYELQGAQLAAFFVPEPSAFLLLLAGLGGLAGVSGLGGWFGFRKKERRIQI